jgi:mono/diheme cytochrome c family protein
VIRVILDGTRAVATDSYPTPLSMPSFKWKLSNDQVAALASYIRRAWGNVASAVSTSDVQSMRAVVGASTR